VELLAYSFAFGFFALFSRMNILGLSHSVAELAVQVEKIAEMSAGRKLNKVKSSDNFIDCAIGLFLKAR